MEYSSKFFKLVYRVLKPVFSAFYLKTAEGLENLPKEGGFVLCINHISAWDPLFVASRMDINRRVYYLAKKELFENKILRAFITWLGAIPVDRGNADLSAIRASLKVLKEGHGLAIFPQGTRSRDNSPTPMLSGASMIALRGGVPVIPCYIDGPYRFMRRAAVRFGKPLDLSEFGRKCDAETLNEVTRRIEKAVWGMRDLPKS